jgi:hypothetical protein
MDAPKISRYRGKSMKKTCSIYIIPFLAGVNFEANLQDHEWQKFEHNIPIRITEEPLEEYTKKIIHGGNEYSIVYRKYKSLNSFSFIIIGRSIDTQMKNDIDEFNSIFHKYRTECGLLDPSFYINYVLRFYESSEDLQSANSDSHVLFSESYDGNKLYCIGDNIYNLMIKFDSPLSNQIRDNMITLISESEIAYHFQPYISNESVLQEKLRFGSNDLLDIFWLNKFLLLKCPGSCIFPNFFREKLAIIDTLLDFRNKKIAEGLFNAAKAQSESLEEIKRVESGILFLTLFVSIDVIFSFSTDLYHAFSWYERFLLILIFLLSIIVSILVWKYILPEITRRWHLWA